MDPYWEGDGVAIYHADTSDPDVRAALAGLRAQHILTDPPFAPATHDNARTRKGMDADDRDAQDADHTLVTFPPITVDDIRHTLGVISPTRWTVMTADWHYALPLEQLPPRGMRFVRHGVWVKPNGAPQFTGDRPAQGWEAVLILHALGGRMVWNGGGSAAVWRMPRVQVADYPTQKPQALLDAWVRQFTDPGDLIIDPYMGSGTTLMAARAAGRRAVGVDISADACALAVQRLTIGVQASMLDVV